MPQIGPGSRFCDMVLAAANTHGVARDRYSGTWSAYLKYLAWNVCAIQALGLFKKKMLLEI